MRSIIEICDEIRRRDHRTCTDNPAMIGDDRRRLHGITLTIAEGLSVIEALDNPPKPVPGHCFIGPWVLIPAHPHKIIIRHVHGNGEWMETDASRLALAIGEYYARHF